MVVRDKTKLDSSCEGPARLHVGAAGLPPGQMPRPHEVRWRAKAGDRAPIILLEFNELCPPLLEKWMAEGQLPNFKAFHDSSSVFVTQADAETAPYLEPWIQWYSLHTGLSYQQHNVFHLTDGLLAEHEDIWHLLAERGWTVANCASINAKELERPGCFFLPDPWCGSDKTNPADLRIFSRLVSHYVREHTNEGSSLGVKSHLSFLMFMVLHGLRVGTIGHVLRQLMRDTLIDRSSRWKRATVLDKMQFDVFRHYYRRVGPSLSTFFLNSTAHFQHTYWRHMAPEAFRERPSDQDLARYENAILFGYRQMDGLLADFYKLEQEGAMLIMASALSQQPYLKYEYIGGHRFYRLRNLEKFLDAFDIAYSAVFPVMANHYLVRFPDERSTARAERILRSFKYNGLDVFGFSKSEPLTLYFGSQIRTEVPEDGQIQTSGRPEDCLGFHKLFYKISETKSGCHHPDGVLWVKTGKHIRHNDKVSILDVFPTILDYFDVGLLAGTRNAYMGKSLWPMILENGRVDAEISE